jgi:hypothetical protein
LLFFSRETDETLLKEGFFSFLQLSPKRELLSAIFQTLIDNRHPDLVSDIFYPSPELGTERRSWILPQYHAALLMQNALDPLALHLIGQFSGTNELPFLLNSLEKLSSNPNNHFLTFLSNIDSGILTQRDIYILHFYYFLDSGHYQKSARYLQKVFSQTNASSPLYRELTASLDLFVQKYYTQAEYQLLIDLYPLIQVFLSPSSTSLCQQALYFKKQNLRLKELFILSDYPVVLEQIVPSKHPYFLFSVLASGSEEKIKLYQSFLNTPYWDWMRDFFQNDQAACLKKLKTVSIERDDLEFLELKDFFISSGALENQAQFSNCLVVLKSACLLSNELEVRIATHGAKWPSRLFDQAVLWHTENLAVKELYGDLIAFFLQYASKVQSPFIAEKITFQNAKAQFYFSRQTDTSLLKRFLIRYPRSLYRQEIADILSAL